MGCAMSNDVVQINHPHINRYLQIMRLDHPLNINKKYEHICKIYPNETVGEGTRRTVAYDCLVTEAEFFSKRKQFWETRTSGEKTCWATIELALQSQDEAGLRAILQSAGIRTLSNSIQMCVDQKIVKYQVPVFCINMPKTFSKTSVAETHLDKNFVEKPLTVKIRSTKFVTDSVLSVNTKTSIGELKKMFRASVKLADSSVVRTFYRGRELNDQFFIGNYGVRDNDVITAMIIM